MPNPAYLCDSVWNIIGYNAAMAEWWPWVLEPDANLIRWALLSAEARRQFVDWPHHAGENLALLRFAAFQHPKNTELAELLSDILQDPDCRRLWEERTDVSENRDGHHFQIALPKHDYAVIEVVSSPYYPAGLPDSRLVVITWIRDDYEPADSTGELVLGIPAEEFCYGRSRPGLHRSRRRLGAATAEKATAAAGPDAIPLPALSAIAGDDVHLVISPSTQSVLWATRQESVNWSIIEHDPYTVVTRLPSVIPTPDARTEFQKLIRAALPADPSEATERIQNLTALFNGRVEALKAVGHELAEGRPSADG